MRHGNPWFKERLIAAGFRNTESRTVILNILSRTSHHLSAEDVYFLVRSINPSIGVATVYRTLDLLTKMGIVQKFDFGEGKARYELVKKEKENSLHHHLICTRCKKIIDCTNIANEGKELVKKTGEILSKKHNFSINSHIINFYGICEDCNCRHRCPTNRTQSK